jgi:hypothetical protein
MSSQHTDVAAYSFGLLEEADRLDFEAHLGGCETCAAELAELADLADLFAGVEPVEILQDAPGDAVISDLVRRRASEQRKHGRRQAWLGVAAGVVLLAGGVTAGVAAAPTTVIHGPVALAGQVHGATNQQTGVSAKVGLEAKAWGTQVTLDLAGVHGPLDCQLVAVSRTGERRVIAGWFVPASGYGVPGHPGHLVLMGGTAIAMKDMSQVEVDIVHGATLVQIPVSG